MLNYPLSSIENCGDGRLAANNTLSHLSTQPHATAFHYHPSAFGNYPSFINPIPPFPLYQTSVNLQVRAEVSPSHAYGNCNVSNQSCVRRGEWSEAATELGNNGVEQGVGEKFSISGESAVDNLKAQDRTCLDIRKENFMLLRGNRGGSESVEDLDEGSGGANPAETRRRFNTDQEERKYRERRMKNNEAAKQSRSKRREREGILRQRVEELEKENLGLRLKLSEIQSRTMNNGRMDY